MSNFELKDTVEGMCSDDYRVRFVAEYQQVKYRYEHLKSFCNEIEAAELKGEEGPKHDCPLKVLRTQQRHMGWYLHDLELRAKLENIVLE